MSGPRGLTLAIVLLLGCASRGSAQAVVNRNGSGTDPYRGVTDQREPYGGFGLEPMRTPNTGRLWVDRFGTVRATQPAPAPLALTPRRPSASALTSQSVRRSSKTEN